MAKFYNALEGSQTDINRRLLRRIEALEKGETGETADITALKTAVGDKDSGLVKDIADIKTAIGKASGEGAAGILKDVADIKTDIGTDATEGTIKGRIYALEDHE